MEEKDICQYCKTYLDKKDYFLSINNSAYSAAMNMVFFIDDCKKTCSGKLEEVVYTRDTEEPGCERCDHCTSGDGGPCGYCNQQTKWCNYERTERRGGNKV